MKVISRFVVMAAIVALMVIGGNTAAWAVCSLTSPSFTSDFTSNQDCLAKNGASAFQSTNDGTVLRLTQDLAGQAGSAWFNVPQPVSGGFSTTFQFRFSQTGPAHTPADGIAFVIQNSSLTALGQGGGSIGYADGGGLCDVEGGQTPCDIGGGIPNSLAVEFDTYNNSSSTGDPSANHIAVQSCGINGNQIPQPNSPAHTTANDFNFPNCVIGQVSDLSNTGINMSDGNVHTVVIGYTPASNCDGDTCPGSLSVTVDTISVLTTTVTIENELNLTGTNAFVGFTSATGAAFENHDIVNWTFTLPTVTVQHDTPPNVTTKFDFVTHIFKSTPAASTQTNNLAITAIPVNPSVFNASGPGAPFPTAQCLVYGGNNGNCIELDVKCTGPNCGGTYDAEFSTSFDFSGPFIGKPGFLKVKDKSCSPTIFADPTTTNQITAFIVQRQDPTTKGKSGGTGSCWVAVQGLSSTTYPNTDLTIVKVAPPLVKKGTTLTYGIAVLNLGPSLATGVSVTDPIPFPNSMSLVSSAVCITGTSGVSCTTNHSVIPPCTVTSDVVTCQVGNLLPFSLRTLAAAGIQLTFQLTPNNLASGTVISNTATVQAINTDPKPNNNTSTAKTKVCTNIVGLKCVQ